MPGFAHPCRRETSAIRPATISLLLAAAALSSCAANAARTPLQKGDLICSFETDGDVAHCTGTAPFAPSNLHATDGARSIEVDLNAAEATFGLRADGAPFDFRGARKLLFDVYRPGDPCHIILRVFDRKKNRYVCWYTLVRPGANLLEFDVHGMSAELDLSAIDEFVFYAERPAGKLYVDHVRLSRSVEPDESMIPPPPRTPHRAVRGNLVKNGGFELGLAEWESWGEWDDGKYLFGTAQGESAHAGAASAQIIAQKVGRGGIWSQPIYLPPGAYRLQFAARGNQRDVRMFWTFDGDAKHHIVTGMRCDPFTVPDQWKTFRFEVGVARSAAVVRLYFFSVGAGTLSLDDISLVRTDGEATPDSETSHADWNPRKTTVEGVQTFVDGKPFFPIGIFNGRPEALRGTGINFIVSGMPDRDLLDRCRQHGIMICPNLQGVMRAHLPWQAPQVIEPIQRHPAILAWYLCDEPDHAGWTVPPAEMRLATSLLNRADPFHPVWTVVMSWADSNLYQYADTVNILSTDVYPFADGKKNPIDVVGTKTDVMRRAVRNERPVWMTTQSTKAATPEENRAMTYLAICSGARGIVYWEFFEAFEDPATWKTISELTMELKAFTPVLTTPEPSRTAAASHPAVRAMVREYDGSLFIFAVNGSPMPIADVRIAVSDLTGARTAHALIEKRELPEREGRFQDSFRPYERHIYEIPLGRK